ncbi:extracellular solute-binding protein [Nocardioides sp. LMS-CY]|uniref:Alpha-glucoside transport system substrate-binding protein n=1 Tax=Nocardioides soli TaxID=1036020 RepID=A0A7W4VV22_9ACTN|nr:MULTISPECIES: ABC transporter substrate-binding protein [Nocardioides]MBB3042058.1 alpha-glucoside transport system substrate-binding protein [Nocardioides soli]QWF21537.1 extracellular solute-binding protein [Nocardioides sp. LMS-CY]
MRSRNMRRGLAAAAALASAGLVLASCASDDDGGSSEASGTWPGDGKSECSGLEQLADFGDLSGKSVSVYTSILPPEQEAQENSYKLFTTCTGASVKYEGSDQFETQLVVRVKANNAPDIAYIPQPGLLKTVVDSGQVVEAPSQVADNVDEFFGEDWKGYGTVDDTFYAAPLGASVKSFVWYSPSMFQKNGWEVPETWDDLMSLTGDIAATGIKPWCAGIESGDATGWPATDWLEDVLLRDAGPDVYDQWVNHDIAFNDDAVAEALDKVGAILKDPKYVNGGFGDVDSIATTAFQDAGQPILKDQCALHRMASFYAAQWPEGTKVTEDGDVFAFYLPVTNEDFGKPVLGAGEFVAAFDDRPEVAAFQTYLSTDVWANEKAKSTPGGGWVSANTGLDEANLSSPIDKLSAEIFQDPDATFRFDGSDQMPSAVGAGSFWKEMTAWVTGESTKDALTNIENSWPSS